jgi:hypothetical protein
MVDGVDGARAQQRRPAGARQDVQRTGDARHLAIGEPKNDKEWKQGTTKESRWETTRGESTAKFSGKGA